MPDSAGTCAKISTVFLRIRVSLPPRAILHTSQLSLALPSARSTECAILGHVVAVCIGGMAQKDPVLCAHLFEAR